MVKKSGYLIQKLALFAIDNIIIPLIERKIFATPAHRLGKKMNVFFLFRFSRYWVTLTNSEEYSDIVRKLGLIVFLVSVRAMLMFVVLGVFDFLPQCYA